VADLVTLLVLVSLFASRQAVLGPDAHMADNACLTATITTVAGATRVPGYEIVGRVHSPQSGTRP
jgi:hypothetical protein